MLETSGMKKMKIAIIGAGIGGLTLALALRQRGIDALVFEQSPALTEIGAAVALSANSTRELRRLGLLDAVTASSTEPTELIYRDWSSGRTITSHPMRLGGTYQQRFGAPYFGIHRADFQRTLGEAVGLDTLRLGHKLTAIEQLNGSMKLSFSNGHVECADVAVGADGVRSVIRDWVTGGAKPQYSGTSAFRGIVPVELLPALPDPQAIQFWLGPDAHLLHYAIGPNGGHVNFFAVVESPKTWPTSDRWTIDTKPGEAVAAFAGWHPAVIQMIAASTFASRWGLFVVPPLARWHRGNAVLIGDSAHAMLPHHGQGANTSIEDSIVLAALLAESKGGRLDVTFARFEELRRLRTRRIQRSSWAANTAFHLSAGAASRLRDDRLSRFPNDFGWIHEYDALAAATSAVLS
jgi:salicylate hydroxylase